MDIRVEKNKLPQPPLKVEIKKRELILFLFLIIILLLVILVSVGHLEAGYDLSFRPSLALYVGAVHFAELFLMRLGKAFVFTFVLRNPVP